MGSLTHTFLTAAVGLVTGALGAILASSAKPLPPTSDSAVTAVRSGPSGAAVTPSHTIVVERVIEAAPTSTAPATSPAAAAPPAAVQPLSAEQEATAHRTLIAHHFAEPVDAAWSKPTQLAFEHDLEDAAKKGGFETAEVACRQVTCRATVRWPSFQEAVNGYAVLGKKEYGTNCGVHVALVDEPLPGKPYSTTVLFDCERAKYGD